MKFEPQIWSMAKPVFGMKGERERERKEKRKEGGIGFFIIFG